MTRRKPRTFTPEFRQMAVDLALKGDQTIAELERELGLSDGLLRQWVKKYHAATAAGKTVEQVADERQELARLRREIARLQEENAILKKAVTMTHSVGTPRTPPRAVPVHRRSSRHMEPAGAVCRHERLSQWLLCVVQSATECANDGK